MFSAFKKLCVSFISTASWRLRLVRSKQQVVRLDASGSSVVSFSLGGLKNLTNLAISVCGGGELGDSRGESFRGSWVEEMARENARKQVTSKGSYVEKFGGG